MGLIDPMLIGNAAATGVIAFSTGPVLAALTGGLLGSAVAGILASRRARLRSRRFPTATPALRVLTAGAVAK